MVNADLGSFTCAHFPLRTDVGSKCTLITQLLDTGNCQRAGFSASSVPTSIGYLGEQQIVLTLQLGCPGHSNKNFAKMAFLYPF